jgi:hypothetical protein
MSLKVTLLLSALKERNPTHHGAVIGESVADFGNVAKYFKSRFGDKQEERGRASGAFCLMTSVSFFSTDVWIKVRRRATNAIQPKKQKPSP